MKDFIICIVMMLIIAIASSSCTSRISLMDEDGKVHRVAPVEYTGLVAAQDTVVISLLYKENGNRGQPVARIYSKYVGKIPNSYESWRIYQGDTVSVLTQYKRAVRIE